MYASGDIVARPRALSSAAVGSATCETARVEADHVGALKKSTFSVGLVVVARAGCLQSSNGTGMYQVEFNHINGRASDRNSGRYVEREKNKIKQNER